MYFVLRGKNVSFPELDYGLPGRELECFIPDGFDWEQENYGQGEGQVAVGGCSWGFFISDGGDLSVHLHDGTTSLEDAFRFVKGVRAKVFGERGEDVEIFLIGCDD